MFSWNKNTLAEAHHAHQCSMHLRLSSHPCQIWLLLLQPILHGGAAQPGSESSQEHTNPCELHSLAKNAVWRSKLSTSFSSRTRNRFFLQSRDFVCWVFWFFFCFLVANIKQVEGVWLSWQNPALSGVRRLGWLQGCRNAVSSWPPHPRESCTPRSCRMKRVGLRLGLLAWWEVRLGQGSRAVQPGSMYLAHLYCSEEAWECSREMRCLVVFSKYHLVLETVLLRAQFQGFQKISVLFRGAKRKKR